MLPALAIHQASGKLKQLIDDHWTILEKVQSEQNIELLQQVTPQLRDLSEYTPAEIWQAVQAKKTDACILRAIMKKVSLSTISSPKKFGRAWMK